MAKWKISEGMSGKQSFIAELSDDMELNDIMQLLIEHNFAGTDGVDGGLTLLPGKDGSLCLVDNNSGYPYAYLSRYTPSSFGAAVAQAEAQSAAQPHCPTCGSTDITRQGIIGRAFTSALIGGFAPESRAQFQCNKCGYMW